MSKMKFYLPLFVMFSISALLFGISYSKESGVSNYTSSVFVKDNMKIAYSDGNEIKVNRLINKKDYLEVKSYSLGITNLSKNKINYVIKVNCDKDCFNNNVYYSIDDNEPVLLNGRIIYENHVNTYGKTNDYQMHNIRLFTSDSYDGTVSFEVEEINLSKLYSMIYKDNNVYYDGKDYRYYGTNINNYINYQGNSYRILGIIGNKIKLISNNGIVGMHDNNVNYLSLNDFLASFNNVGVNKDNIINYASWLKEGRYWFADSSIEGRYYFLADETVLDDIYSTYHNVRTVVDLDKDINVLSGKGSIDEPYEVNYEG